MRPRLARRGELDKPLAASGQNVLQCGHGSLAVENTGSITVMPPSTHALQCGHGSLAVENGERTSAFRDGGKSFNAATARSPWRTRNTDQPFRYRDCCFNAATARSPWRTPIRRLFGRATLRLQCGHGSLAVENDRQPDRRLDPQQASMRPRLARRGERADFFGPASAETTLQCGHGSLAVENIRQRVRQPARVGASMRPRLARRGERSGRCGLVCVRCRFNAATARTRRG